MRTWIIIGIIAVVLVGGGVGAYRWSQRPSPLDPFAQCLTQKGVKMYGASWCPHCKKQKDLFGRAFRNVSYIECAMPGNPQAQTLACRDAKIEGYPTWVFADGSRVSGEQELTDLAQKAGCALPVGQQ